MENNSPRFYEFGEFRLDTKRRILFKNNDQVPLTARLYELLYVLVKSEGKVLEHNELLDEVWDGAFVEQSNLKKSISALRQILGEQANESRFISTVPRRGYSFVADVFTSDDSGFIQIKETEREIIIEEEIIEEDFEPTEISNQKSLPSIQQNKSANYLIYIIPLIVLLLAFVAIFFSLRSDKKTLASNLSLTNLKAQKLTNSGNVQEAGISPDGQVVIYALGQSDGKQSLWTRRVASPNAIQIAEPAKLEYRAIVISPDNNFVYYGVTSENSKDELYKLSVFGGTPKKITENIRSAVSFSPDSKKIAFARDIQGVGRKLIIANADDGSDEKEIYSVTDNHNLINPVWSPDGKNFVFISSDVTEKGRIWELKEISAEGGTPRSLTQAKKGKIFLEKWLSDGSGLVITAKPDDLSQSQVWKVDYPSGEITRLTNDVLDYINIEASKNADSLLALQQEKTADLWATDMTNMGEASQITYSQNLLGDFIVLPDGRILSGVTENGLRSVSVINPDGGNIQSFLDKDDVYRIADFSTLQNILLFTSLRTGTEQIYQADLNGNNIKQLTDEKTFIANARFSKDGKLIYYNRIEGIPWKLVKRNIETGETSLVLNEPSRMFDLHPDGTSLIHDFYDETSKKWKIAVRNLSDNSIQKIFDIMPSSFLCWSFDGKSFFYNVSDIYLEGGNVWQKSLDDSPSKLFLDAKSDKIYDLHFSQDGKKIYFTRGKLNSNIVLLTKESAN